MTAPRKIWRAGTLTYTTGGLVLLCFWLLWGDFPWAMKTGRWGRRRRC